LCRPCFLAKQGKNSGHDNQEEHEVLDWCRPVLLSHGEDSVDRTVFGHPDLR